jgi:hypothetical protein
VLGMTVLPKRSEAGLSRGGSGGGVTATAVATLLFQLK